MRTQEFAVCCDLDGVICDFDKKIQDLTGKRIEDQPKKEVWKAVETYNKNVAPFYESLEKMAGADKLIDFLVTNFSKVSFLTASGDTPRDAPAQKLKWCNKHYPNIPCTVVKDSHLKAIYANPNTILVDDRARAVDPWVKAGGIAVMYKNVDQAIEELKKYVLLSD